MKIVFLDFDGVVNREIWTIENGKNVLRYGYPEDGAVNDTQSVQWICEFCERFGYDVVVTSTWRKHPEWEKFLRGAGWRENVKILGATSFYEDEGRREEIADYLRGCENVEHFLIFDDNMVDGYERNVIICDKARGFGRPEYEKAAMVATFAAK